MSRTMRRQKGDRWFVNPTRRNMNNPLYFFKPYKMMYVNKEVKVLDECLTELRGKPRYKTLTKRCLKFCGFNDLPSDDNVAFDAKFAQLMQRDSVLSRRKSVGKEFYRTLDRSNHRDELAKIKKINNYEDMDYVNTKLPKLDWFYD